MTKDVVLYIRGMQMLGESGDDEIDTISRGKYYSKGKWQYLVYDEHQEDWEEISHIMIKFNSEEVILMKKGLMNYQMIFRKNIKNVTPYITPFGEFLVGMETHSVDVEQGEDEIIIKISYTMEMNHEAVAETALFIGVEAVKGREEKDA